EEGGGLGLGVFPGAFGVHGERPLGGAAQAGEDVEEGPLGDDAGDGAAPVGDNQALVKVGGGDEVFDGAGEVAEVAQRRRELGGKRRGFPAGDEHLGVVLVEQVVPLRGGEVGGIDDHDVL